MNEYERLREERIAANKKYLAELISTSLLSASGKEPQQRKRRTAEDREEDGPRLHKSSARLRSVPTSTYVLEDDPEDWPPRRTTRRAEPGERGEYGAEGASSCHSCRQKTTSYKAKCTKCILAWCAPCLRIRYGEDAAEVNTTGTWICGKCRGNCLCSNCRRKAGKTPTGVLGPAAAAASFESVAEYLIANPTL